MPTTLPPVTILLNPHHHRLTFMSPLSQRRAEALVRFATEDLEGTVLDIGCGWAELLLRVVAAAPRAVGLGVDTNEGSIEHGKKLAEQRGLADRVTLLVGDARELAPQRADAVICIGASQVWGAPVEDNLPLDYAAALTALRKKVSPGARVIYGEAVWSRPPTLEAVTPLAGRLDEFVSLEVLIELAVTHGFMPVAIHEANTDEWDQFESGYSACYADWLAQHGADHVDADEVRARAARQRASYYDGYRGILGMAYLALVAV